MRWPQNRVITVSEASFAGVLSIMSSQVEKPDFLVIGGGIVGINIARELKRRHTDARVSLIEKEASSCDHSSGRNSGVLHAGFYYTADSLKARFTREGNRRLTAYCESRNIPLNKCGKLVVARDADEDQVLDELLRRANLNGVQIEEVSAAEAREIEPRARTYRRALFSPTTSSASPVQVVESMRDDALREGVEIRYSEPYLERRNGQVRTPTGWLSPGYVVNAAGLYAEKVSRDFGFGEGYTILPFKGLYLKSNEPPGAYRTHIYPVPDLKNPFLGVHVTVQADGRAKIGPTAIPAFWREQYQGMSNFRWGEFSDVIFRSLALLTTDGNFRRLAAAELRKYSRRHLVSLAGGLAAGIETRNFTRWGPPGIRAQLFDVKKKQLEMDFVIEGDERSMHVLNAVSPGWTCAIPFSEHVVDRISEQI